MNKLINKQLIIQSFNRRTAMNTSKPLISIIIFSIIFSFMLLLQGCNGKPDLHVAENEHDIDSEPQPNYVINLKIGNQGNAATTTEALVYINAISDAEHPGVNPIRIQNGVKVPPLNAGQTSAIFTVKIPMYEIHAKEINRFEILVDPKSQIEESNESNNHEAWSL
jgi:hypothetical protein